MLNDLSEIRDLQAGYLVLLNERLGIRTPEDLLLADRRVIRSAITWLRPKPTLEDISGWQDQARDLISGSTVTPDQGWDQVAAFVVSFERRGEDQRLVVEQAEHALPQPRTEVPGWNLEAAAAWMLHQAAALGAENAGDRDGDSEIEKEPTPSLGDDDRREALTAMELPPVETTRPALRIATIALGGPDGEEHPLTDTGSTFSEPASLLVEVAGPPVPIPVHVVVRVQPPGRPGITVAEAVTSTGTIARLDLSSLPAGGHRAVVATWAENGAAEPAVAQLPRLVVAESRPR